MKHSTKQRFSRFSRNAMAALAAAAAVAGAEAQSSSWVGGPTGVWSSLPNWSSGVPNSTSYTAIIDGGNVIQNTTVTLDISTSIGTLNITAGDALTFANGVTLTIGGPTTTNAGTITVAAGANNTFLNLNGVSSSLTGGGTLVLSQSAGGAALIAGTGTLTNVNNTIRGVGNIGNNTLAFTNQGTVNADVAGGVLNIDMVNVANALNNSGLMTATNGGFLQLNGANGGNITNTTGTISAQNGSVVGLVNNINVSGGTLTTSGTGLIRVISGHNAGLDTFTNLGNISLDNNSQLFLNGGTITNNGSINVNAAANNTFLTVNGTQAIGGTGTINLIRTAGGNSIITGSGSWTTSNTIQGAGNIGNNAFQIINNKLIQATDATNGLVIDPANVSGGVTNNGTLLANGGVLVLTGANGGDFLNTSGKIISGSTDVQLVTNASITGGTLSSTGAGAIRLPAGNSAFASSFATAANIQIDNNSQFSLTGGVNNTGSININAVANNTYLTFGTVTLSGAGTITMGTTGGASAIVNGSGGTLTNVNNFIHGRGELGNNTLPIINQAAGVVQADSAGAVLNVDPPNVATAFRNQGVMRATGGGILQLTGANGGGFDNTGASISAQTGSEVRLVTNVSITGGSLSSSGSGFVDAADGNDVYLDALALSGDIRIGNNARILYSNALALTGSLSVNAGANASQFYLNGSAVAITGTGSIVLKQTAGNFAYLDGTGTLTLGVPVSGGGYIGNNTLTVINNSTITANAAGQYIMLDPANLTSFTNNGTILASGGTMYLTGANGGTFENSTGKIISAANDVNLVSNASINSGTFASSGAGAIHVPNGNAAFVNAITNTGNISVDNNSDLYVTNTITNAGSISLNPVANNSRLLINGGTVNLTGAGTVFLNTGTTGGAGIISGTGTLVSNQNIRGGGFVGSNAIFVTNNSTMTADDPSYPLVLDPVNVASGFTNNGTLVTTGGVLQITGANGGDFNNTAGRIISGTGDVQLFSSASITGGTLSSTGAGAFHVLAGHTAYLSGVTTSANIQLDNNADLWLSGTIANSGSISINPIANSTRLLVNSTTVTLNGTGTVLLNASASSGVAQVGGSGTLISNQNIRGGGLVGTNSVFVVNNSTMTATSPLYPLVLDPVNASGGFTNNGTLLTTGGVLQITGANGGDFNNTSGRIISGTSDVQMFASASITGGTLSSIGAGAFHVLSGHTVYMNTLTNAGNIQEENNTDLWISGTITNTGSITLNSTANNTRLLSNSATVTLNGGGTINLVQTGGGQAIIGNAGTLTNVNNLIRGSGNIGANSLAFVNSATIQADVAATSIVIDPVNVTGGFTNNGLLRASNGGQIYVTGANGGNFIGTGSVDVQASSFFTADTSAGFTNGAVASNGTVTVQNSSNVNVASIAGNGTLNISNSSTVTIRANGTQAATSKVVSYSNTTSSRLDLNDNAMVIDYTGTSPFSTVRSQVISGYNNGLWNGVGIDSTSSVATPTKSLGYAEASATPFTTTFRGQTFAGGDAVLLMYTYKGDANLDRTVSSLDFNQFIAGYGIKDGSAYWSQGDFDYNGKVNTLDFNWLAGNFGQTLPAAGELPGPTLGSVVPEPVTIALIPLAMTLVRRRK